MHIQRINELVARIIEGLPAGLLALPKEVQAHLKAALQEAFTKMDLVTQEEFSAQKKVLLRAHRKLEELEKLVNELENKLR